MTYSRRMSCVALTPRDARPATGDVHSGMSARAEWASTCNEAHDEASVTATASSVRPRAVFGVKPPRGNRGAVLANLTGERLRPTRHSRIEHVANGVSQGLFRHGVGGGCAHPERDDRVAHVTYRGAVWFSVGEFEIGPTPRKDEPATRRTSGTDQPAGAPPGGTPRPSSRPSSILGPTDVDPGRRRTCP